MRFPEDELTTYLRVFMPDGRIEEVLDAIAAAAIERGVEEEVEIFHLAHHLMDADDRRTPEVEAVVLVEEVGLARSDVARVVEIPEDRVREAVEAAWAEVEGEAVPVEGPRHDEVPDDEVPDDEVPDDGVPDDEVPDDEVPVIDVAVEAQEVAGARRRPPGTLLGWGVVVVALVVVLLAALTGAGQQRLAAQGLQPLVTVGLVVVLLGGGAALLRATTPPDAEDGPEDAAALADQPPVAGQQQHQPDEDR